MIPEWWAFFPLSDYCGSPNLFQGEMMAATERVYPLLRIDTANGTSWRTNPENFYSGAQARSGTVGISPAWFQQGHDVSDSVNFIISRQLI